MFRVYQGTVKSNSEVWNSAREQSERIGQLYLPRGKAQEKCGAGHRRRHGGHRQAVRHGDRETTLCTRDHAVEMEPIEFPTGYYGVAVVPATKADLDKMSTALNRIVEEDPTLHLSRSPDTNETLLTGLGRSPDRGGHRQDPPQVRPRT